MTDIAEVLGRFRASGVQLWVQNGELRYRAPKGALTAVEIERLRASKGVLLKLLGSMGSARVSDPPLEPRASGARVPLTFCQLAHWRARRLAERPGVRQVACVTRVRGSLDVGLLQQSLAQVVCRHEALRTRIGVIDGVPTQLIDPRSTCELQVYDLREFSADARNAEVQHLIDDAILGPVDFLEGGLLALRLARRCHDDYVLIGAMEHLVSDARSINILHRDLFTLYRTALVGGSPALPAVTVQFGDYAVWQQRACGEWIAKHADYWRERVEASAPLRFPSDGSTASVDGAGWGIVPLTIDGALRSRLVEWSQPRGTTLVMSIFTAYAALVLRWCKASEGVLRYQSDGRHRLEVENTVGFFAAVLNVRIELHDRDTFLDALDSVTKEYCEAHEHADFSYLDTLQPPPEFVGNPGFNWVPEEPRSGATTADRDSRHALTLRRVSFENPLFKTSRREGEPLVLLYDHGEEIVGGIHFPQWRFSASSMQRFGRNFLMLIDAMLQQPEECVREIELE